MADQTPLEHRTAEVNIDASPEEVYDLVADIPRIGEWSTDLDDVYFVEGYREAAEGARFQGQNKVGPVKRTSDCKVYSARRGEEFAWEVVDGEWPVTRWRFRMESQGDRTRLQESVELIRVPASSKVLWLLQGGQENHMQKLEQSMQQTLEQVKAKVEEREPAAAAS